MERPPALSRLVLSFLVSLAPATRAQEPALEAERPDFWRALEVGVEARGLKTEYETVLEHMGSVVLRRGKLEAASAQVRRGLAQPWAVPEIAADFRARLASPVTDRRRPDWRDEVARLSAWLSAGSASIGEAESVDELEVVWSEIRDPDRRGRALLESLSTYLELLHLALDDDLARLDSAQFEVLFARSGTFREAWYRSHFPDNELPADQNSALEAMRDLMAADPLGRGRQLGVLAAVLRLTEPGFVRSLAPRLAGVRELVDEGVFGPGVLAVVGADDFHRVVLAGRGADTHAARAALVIDLGGNDHYERAAVVDGADALVSVVLDLEGDDVYECEGSGIAAATGGVALLADLEGDDRYTCGRFGQGAAALGTALLLDLEGDDHYEAEDFAQGHASCGVGLLYDFEGDDRYSAWAVAQAGGIGPGLSALVDGEGDDHYLADLKWPDVYGNSGPDVHHGASQGYCTGIRPQLVGGFAALIDLGDGRDRYQSGSFSQGGGYYFSFGLMYDGGGDDENFGSRYSQGFGVHQAIGVRWDAAGDDRYTCRSVAHTGMGWDEGVGYLIDDGGDDTYRTGDLSCGGAAQTAIAICLDRGGTDRYETGRQSQGGSGSSEYHDKPALGVLIDLGGRADHFSAEGRAVDAVRLESGLEFFFDGDERALRARLEAKGWE